MDRLIVKNFGPLKDVDIELNKINLFDRLIKKEFKRKNNLMLYIDTKIKEVTV